MRHNLIHLALTIALLLALAACYSLKRDQDALRVVIQDKNVYIDAGCHGRYQGEGDALTRDQMELQPQYY